MLLKFLIVLVLCFVKLIQSEEDIGYYTIVAPHIFRINSKYHVSVNSQGLKVPVTVNVGVESQNTGVYSVSKTISLEPYTTQIVELDIGNINPGEYKLVAKGLSGLIFSNETKISLNTKAFSIFVQTDKAIYKPGDTVKFRVITLNSDLKPALIKDELKVFIQDADRNRIKQWNNVKTIKGVFSGEIELSTAPILGTWSIKIETTAQEQTKTFDVDEYVLPKFEVLIDTPKHGTFKQENIAVIVKSKYTFGKFVKGKLTVSAKHIINRSGSPNIVIKTVPIDGKAVVVFNRLNELGINGHQNAQNVLITAIVEEALTGHKQNSTFTVTLHKSKYKLEIIKETMWYVPGLPFKAWVKVSDHYGVPIRDTINKVRITYDRIWAEEVILNEDGMAQIEYIATENFEYGYNIRATYLDVETDMYVPKKRSTNSAYITAVLKTEIPTINEDIEIDVLSTIELKYFTYQVIGRGDIIASSTVIVPNTRKHTFKFLATPAMMPNAKVLVYFVHSDGTFVFHKIKVDFPAAFQNTVKVILSDTQLKPGENLNITVTSAPNSFVGLLGVDQSVLLLQKGNDLSSDDIFNELKLYDQATPVYQRAPLLRPWVRPRRVRREFDDYYFPDFEGAGTVILTNVKPTVPREYLETALYSSTVQKFGDRFNSESIETSNTFYSEPIPKVPEIRKEFPETWIYDVIEDNGIEGRTTIQKKVPDTITSWIITGFAVDPVTGFGMTQTPRKLEVFQPFFISTNLPYSIKRGEVVSIPIVVFNYMNEDVVADVVMNNELQEFEFADLSNEINETPRMKLSYRKQVHVKGNNGATVSFMIKPVKTGYITIKVTAVSPLAGDGVEKPLLVVPEGSAQYVNKAVFIDLLKQSQFNQEITIEIPNNSVPDSTRIEFSVVGDLLGPTIKNLDKLIRMPYGCGEQNMLNFVPNIVVLNYLKATQQLTPEIESKVLKYMIKGYQQEMTYKHPDGSFSIWGKRDQSGSSWLTAFVARSFAEASNFINIDSNIIEDALDWLSSKQAADGSFPEVGRVVDKNMQGGSGKGISLTAYTLITFLENKNRTNIYENTINKALDYIVHSLDGLDDVYSLAIATYALQLSDRPQKGQILSRLQSLASVEHGKMWWSKPVSELEQSTYYYNKPNSVNVEISAYGMLAYLEAGLKTEAIPIMKWLISQRNSQGGFQSTQDTFIGLKALAGLAVHLTSENTNIQVHLENSNGEIATINVNNYNAMVLQSHEVSTITETVSVRATGNGFAMAQISYKYYVSIPATKPRFTLNPEVLHTSNRDHLKLKVCTSYIAIGNDTSSNMAIMEVSFPSGFTSDPETIKLLKLSEGVKRVETKESDTVVVLYFNNLEETVLCPTFTALRKDKVANQKPAPVIVYDYYDNTLEARKFYQIEESSLCDICDGEDCGLSCNVTN